MLTYFIESKLFIYNYIYRYNGDTCLHEGAAYNSWECLLLLSGLVGMELF
jgi:hypothetical protein